MTKNWYKYQTAMVQAELAMDNFHAMLVSNKLKDAQDYIELPSVKDTIVSYYGSDTYQTLLEEIDEALVLPF